jgi:hypothetical protein
MRVILHGFDTTNDDAEIFHELNGPVPRRGDIVVIEGKEWHVGRSRHVLAEGVVYVIAERFR